MLDALLIGFLSLFSKVENKLVAINDVPFHLLLLFMACFDVYDV